MEHPPHTLQYSYETADGGVGVQTNPLPTSKRDASALFARSNGSGPVATPARETPGPIAVPAAFRT